MVKLDLTEAETASLRRAIGFAIMKCHEGMQYSRRHIKAAYELGVKPKEIDIRNVEFSEVELVNLRRANAMLDAEGAKAHE